MSTSIENISPSVLKGLLKEIQQLEKQPLEGIKLVPNESNMADLEAFITGPEGTPYQEGLFHLRITLGSQYPEVPPKCFFITKLFHPNVSKTGEVCVNTLKKDWNKELGIAHILLTIKCLLIDPNPESALNEEAGKLLLENYEEYHKHASVWTKVHASFEKTESQKKKAVPKKSLKRL